MGNEQKKRVIVDEVAKWADVAFIRNVARFAGERVAINTYRGVGKSAVQRAAEKSGGAS